MIAAASGAAADVKLDPDAKVEFGSRYVTCRATPGHTDVSSFHEMPLSFIVTCLIFQGCMSFVLDDNSMVFTGDTLLIRGCGRTDFQVYLL